MNKKQAWSWNYSLLAAHVKAAMSVSLVLLLLVEMKCQHVNGSVVRKISRRCRYCHFLKGGNATVAIDLQHVYANTK